MDEQSVKVAQPNADRMVELTPEQLSAVAGGWPPDPCLPPDPCKQ